MALPAVVIAAVAVLAANSGALSAAASILTAVEKAIVITTDVRKWAPVVALPAKSRHAKKTRKP